MWACILGVYHLTHQSPNNYKPLLPLGSLVLSLFPCCKLDWILGFFSNMIGIPGLGFFTGHFLCLGPLPPDINPSHSLMLHSHAVSLHYCIWNCSVQLAFYSALTLYSFLILVEWAILLCVVLAGVLGTLEGQKASLICLGVVSGCQMGVQLELLAKGLGSSPCSLSMQLLGLPRWLVAEFQEEAFKEKGSRSSQSSYGLGSKVSEYYFYCISFSQSSCKAV